LGCKTPAPIQAFPYGKGEQLLEAFWLLRGFYVCRLCCDEYFISKNKLMYEGIFKTTKAFYKNHDSFVVSFF